MTRSIIVPGLGPWVGCWIALLAVLAPHVHAQWTFQNIDSNGGWYTDVALDAQGGVHAAYYLSDQGVRCAQQTGSTWTMGTLWPWGIKDMATDHAGRVSVVAWTYGGTLFAQLGSDGTWTSQPLTGGCTGASLCFDSLNRPAMAYVDNGASALKYRRWTGASWEVQTVTSSSGFRYANASASVALDAQDAAYFCWWELGTGALKLARPSESGWTVSQFSPAAVPSRILFDDQGLLHMAYTTNNKLYHGVYDGVSWTSQYVDDYAGGTSLSLDAAGQPRIAYVTSQMSPGDVLHTLKYAAFQDSSWTVQTITSWHFNGWASGSAALEIDPLGGAHVVYSDDFGNIGYAYQAGVPEPAGLPAALAVALLALTRRRHAANTPSAR